MVPSGRRAIGSYDAFADAARHEGWDIRQTDLFGIGEVFDVHRQVILLDASFAPADAVAHALAHLDLGHVDEGKSAGSFTEEQERQADFLAAVRLDAEGSRS